MKKKFLIIGGVFIITIGISLLIIQKSKNTLDIDNAEKLITNYLDFLSEKDMVGLKSVSSEEWGKGFNGESNVVLDENLKYAKLLSCELEEKNNDRALISAKVEVVCYDKATEIGDWIPGKSISEKWFEIIRVNDKWKINGWGWY